MRHLGRAPDADSPIIAFYRGTGTDDRGRTLDAIRSFSDDRLEHVHDFIQWLFPLDEPSGANPDAPVLTGDDIATFRADASLRAELLRSLDVMRRFYGVDRSTASSVPQRWLLPHNHNYLRLTRIMKCLRLLGCDDAAASLFASLREIYERHPDAIGATSFAYWRDAAGA
jgi:hypothetical protein